ncbi:hypothetical protein [Mesorhizobium sp.]|uniref:hypothetical protein n=1 Tax=Mesorhizobium sp. TaxID=1871066 RepID=UPI000FE927A7|nr:hypothetical protein [Mesorhizobium sp.]RWO20623.1 MAG: hypothetical protein EOS09_26235 [Mesorhizobium sp.]
MTEFQIAKAALVLARLMRGAQDNDAGNFGHFFDPMTDAEWNAVCDRAEEFMPDIDVTAEERTAWSRASRDFNAEQSAVRVAFACDL